MEVTVVSSETVKPSSPSIKNKKPHKLSLIDQLFPLTYVSGLGFYPNIISSDANFTKVSETLNRLKESLSETLNLYYPFSGRIKNNIYIVDFDSGVPFLEARVNCRMAEYFKLLDHASLTKNLVSFSSLRRNKLDGTPPPLLAVQANVFSCGGVAVGLALCHKIADAASMFYLCNSWAALTCGKRSKVINPNFSDAAISFRRLKISP